MLVIIGAIRRAKLQSNRHDQQTNTQFFTGRMPFLSPKQQCQSTEGKMLQSLITASFGLCLADLFSRGYSSLSWMPQKPSEKHPLELLL